jgi:hypothetical protein
VVPIAARERPTTKPPWAAHIFKPPGFAGGLLDHLFSGHDLRRSRANAGVDFGKKVGAMTRPGGSPDLRSSQPNGTFHSQSINPLTWSATRSPDCQPLVVYARLDIRLAITVDELL